MRTSEEIRNEENAIRDKWFDEWHALGGPGHPYPDWSYEDKISELRKEWYQSLEVGDRVHICRYSDVDPGTVVKKTDKSITVRLDDADRDPDWKPEWIPGGFGAICTNDADQKWIIKEDLEGDTEVFRWSDKYNKYRNKSGNNCYPGWYKYYDYNF